MSSMNLDKYVDDDLMSTILRYGLYIGAVFQLACIVSSILLPSSSEPGDGDSDGAEDLIKHSGEVGALTNVRRLHKLRKQEKKKRR